MYFWYVLFHAVDGIGGFCLSRGLGDVCERQCHDDARVVAHYVRGDESKVGAQAVRSAVQELAVPFPYTHLTQPTIYSV